MHAARLCPAPFPESRALTVHCMRAHHIDGSARSTLVFLLASRHRRANHGWTHS
jgi:hypothetical protein